MRTAIRHHAKPATASTPAHAGSMRPAPARQAARPAPLHDISRVAIAGVAQRKPGSGGNAEAYRAPNRTGLPDRLKAGVEAQSGLSLDQVRVHYNSDKPEQLNARAYAQAADIHLAPGQERHLPHEAWHVVQQAQGRVRPTGQITPGVSINDDASLEAEADRFQTKLGSIGSPLPAGAGHVAAATATSPGIAQMKVEVGGTEYKARKKGHTPKALVREIAAKAKAKSVSLRSGWQTTVREQAEDEINTTSYTDWNDIIAKFKSRSTGAKRKERLDEQDETITGLLSGVGEPVKKRARTIAYESEKASESVRKHIRTTDEYAKTKTELEALPAATIGAANEVSATTSSAFVFEALDQSTGMKRLDFNFHGTPVMTHGYESMGDRTKDASTLKPFGFGPIKIGGDDVGSYGQILKKGTDIRGDANKVLTNLEMFRLPKMSPMTALKRDLYEQGQIPLSEAMAIDSPKSSVEFLGAVSGSGLTTDQKPRMQQQQIISNTHILDDYAARFPNFEIGSKTKDLKKRATPKEIKDAFDKFASDKDKPAKEEARKKLKRTIASTWQVEGYDSSSDVSDFDEDHYT